MRQSNYVCKSFNGREAPTLIPKMCVRISKHDKVNSPNFYSDITFKNYVNVIGTQYYVAYEITQSRVYFKFFKEKNNDIHRFRMFPNGKKKSDFTDGDVVTINVCDEPMIVDWYSDLLYPVYYLNSSDEYFIKIEDGKRNKLFEATCNQIQTRYNSMKTDNMLLIDADKFVTLCSYTGKSIARISRELGYSDSMLNTAIKRGSISTEVATLLEKRFKIKRDQYERFEDTITTKELQPVKMTSFNFTDEIKTELHKVIYSAVYEAVKKAWSE